jgi:polyphosphate glucokinase
MKVLAIDVGGTHVKIMLSGQTEVRKFVSGPALTPDKMVAGVKDLAKDWTYDVASIGYPGPILSNRPVAEPHNLAPGWTGFDFEKAFGHPVKVVNDAAMQALGSYKGGKMLFLGLGTGLGTTLIVDGLVEPMELGHLPYKKATYEDYIGIRGLERLGKKKWRKHVFDIVAKLTAALEPDDVVLGGGNVKNLAELPPGCRAGDNANAFLGGFALWERATDQTIAVAGADTPVQAAPKKTTAKRKKKTKKKARPSASPKKKTRSEEHVDQPNATPHVSEDSLTSTATGVEEPGSPLPEVAAVASEESLLGGPEAWGEANS